MDQNTRSALLNLLRSLQRACGEKQLPKYMPDGTEANTLTKVAAMMNVPEDVAAVYALDSKSANAHMKLQATKALQSPPDSDRNGVILMLQPSISSAIHLKAQMWEAGDQYLPAVPAEDLHITLAYFGTLEDDAVSKSEMIKWAEAISNKYPRFNVPISGVTRFNGGDIDPVVLNPDHAQIEDMRRDGMGMFGALVERSHGYTPHMTIGYLPGDAPMPFDKMPKVDPVEIEYLTLGYGDDYIRFRLGGVGQKDIHTGSAPVLFSGIGNVRHVDRMVQRAKRYKPKKIVRVEKVPNSTDRNVT